MTVRHHAVLAGVAAVLAVVLWWLARDVVSVLPPEVDPPVEGAITRIHTDRWLLLAATVSAGISMVAATRALVDGGPRPIG